MNEFHLTQARRGSDEINEPPFSRKVEPTRSLLRGGSYTPAAHSDIRATFRRVLREMLPDPFDSKELT